MTGTRWIALGTCGGPFQNAAASQIANALVVGERDVYLVDVGNGALRRLAEAGVDFASVRGIFLTHHHPDHIADLGLALLTHWLSPGDGRMVVVGPRGTAHLVAGLAEAFRYTELTETPAKASISERVAVVEAVEADGDVVTVVHEDHVVRVEAAEVAHYRAPAPSESEAPHAIGLRFTTADRVIAYTGDSGATAMLTELACDADLLVSEIVDLDGILSDLAERFDAVPDVRDRVAFNMKHNHLSADSIGLLAAEARVRSVLLTHFVPWLDQNAADAAAQAVSSAAGGLPVLSARDLGVY